MILKNQRYSMGGTTSHKKMLNYDFDTSTKEISNLKIYEGLVSLEDGMFIPDRLKIYDVSSEVEIRDSLNGLKVYLSKMHGINKEEIVAIF